MVFFIKEKKKLGSVLGVDSHGWPFERLRSTVKGMTAKRRHQSPLIAGRRCL